MAPSDSRSLNRCGHDRLVCKFAINVTVPPGDTLASADQSHPASALDNAVDRSKQSSNISMASEQAIMRERVRASTGVRDLERLKRHSLFHLEAGETKKRKAALAP